MSDPQRMILDVDTGLDDAVALALAVNLPGVELVAITTVAGNVDVDRTTRNTLDVLDLLGATVVSVYRGASRPLVRGHRPATYAHGENGLGDVQLPESRRSVEPERGPSAIVRLAEAKPGEVTLVTSGALTNLAMALNLEPELPQLLKRVVMMGGAYRVAGNVTPTAEFNVWEDPEAAAQVLAAPFREIIAVGLDVTNRVRLDAAVLEAVEKEPEVSPAAKLVRDLGRSPFWHSQGSKLALHDPIAVVAAFDPSMFTFEAAEVRVVTEEPELGRTIVTGVGNVQVATEIDQERFFQLFHARLGLPMVSARAEGDAAQSSI